MQMSQSYESVIRILDLASIEKHNRKLEETLANGIMKSKYNLISH